MGLRMKKNLIGVLIALSFSFTAEAKVQKHTFEAEAVKLFNGASKLADSKASGGCLVNLTKPGQAIQLTNLQFSNKIAIRYATTAIGTISVTVNNQPVRKVNIHSSGALTGSFLYSIIDIAIPNHALLTISLADNDVPVNVDKIIVGKGDLELPPDIWNLPPLPVAAGAYPADWKKLSQIYTVPEWWREAKFGVWSHWDPQSMPEQGDWYARGMYMQSDKQYDYNLKNFGHPSEYGYKDICHNWMIDKWNPEELMNLYAEMGARYFMAMGVHHDNFDCWNSTYQPWNSVKVGPKQDIVGT